MSTAKLPTRPAAGTLARLAAVAFLLVASLGAIDNIGAARAATIVIVNENAPGVGFNDPTPADPVGGNPGTTLGEQRLIAFQHAADLWEATLDSDVPIRIGASFVPLSCNITSAVLGAAGATEAWANFPGAPRTNTWYPGALAARLAGVDLTAPEDPHISASFNSLLGLTPTCVPGLTFYLGLDNNAGAQIDLVAVLLHEIAHGLGFQSFTSGDTGQTLLGRPAIWDYYLLDNRSGRTWAQMTTAQRAASARAWRGLSWNGANVTAAVPGALGPAPLLSISGGAAGDAFGRYGVGVAGFGTPLGTTAVRGELMPVVDQANGNGLACSPLNALNALAVRARVALVDRGTCDYTVKARNVQAAGAIGMIVADNVAGEVAGMPGEASDITIPSVRITRADGQRLKTALQARSRTASGVMARLAIDPERLAGADDQRRMLMYSPTAIAPGSSISHYTTEGTPNQLMEPSINADLTHEVAPPRDLTLPLLRDIGW
ncbi:PA domain-containing protein [Telluria beijingensis]|uniref:PA domain-containing protein n=1 Tax=Telluria beijingensis TaxID=3068633 RepID=UPI0027960269|nr:PA domain-containing protein [Massilia sp. REN29]